MPRLIEDMPVIVGGDPQSFESMCLRVMRVWEAKGRGKILEWSPVSVYVFVYFNATTLLPTVYLIWRLYILVVVIGATEQLISHSLSHSTF
jgi:hypothetical protein